MATFLFALPMLARAAIIYPAIDIQNDTGASLTATSFEINATAFAIVNGVGDVLVDIPDTPFTLLATGSYDAVAGTGTFSGNIQIGSLLSASFTNLSVDYVAAPFGADFWDFAADLTYDGGSLLLSGGRIEGSFDTIPSLTAKIATVVPVPAAIWLFGSGLMGLVAVSRRKAC